MNGTPDTTKGTLLFVYNADSGMLSTLKDITHKIVSPDTYECQLCNLTHGYFSMHGEWKAYLDESDRPTLFLHRDEAREQYGISDALPAVYLLTEEGVQQCLDAGQINGCDTLEDLRKLLSVCTG